MLTNSCIQRAAREVVGRATGVWKQKDYKDYEPVKRDTMQACAEGTMRPRDDQIVFYFGKGYEKCLWNRLLLDKLVDKTFDLKAEREFASLADVSKEYIQALLF